MKIQLKYVENESGKTAIKYGTKKAFALTFNVVNWEKEGHRIFDIEDECKRLAKKYFEGLEKKLKFALNCLFYDKRHIVKKSGEKHTEMQKVGPFLSKYTNIDDIHASKKIIDSVTNPFIKKVSIMAIEKDALSTDEKYGQDKHNDCVFNAILKALNYDESRLPSKINKPWKFKKHFGYERDDKVNLKEIVDELESMLKISIEIVGDFTRNPVKQTKNIRLKCKNGHVELQCNDGKVSTKLLSFKEIPADKIYSWTRNSDTTCTFYDGKAKTIKSLTEYNEINESKKYILLYCDNDDELELVRNKFIKKADYFKKLTNGRINFYKCVYTSTIAFELFRQTSKSISEPEEMTDIEHFAHDESNIGGAHYYIEKGTFDNCVDIDQNGMYLYHMSSKKFTFPNNKAEECYLTTTDLNKQSFFKYGLYKCRIIGESKWLPKSQEYKWQTHYILSIAKNEGLKIEMEENNQINFLAYSKDRLNGDYAFDETCKYIWGLRTECDEEYRGDAKLFSSSFWGAFCTKNIKMKYVTVDEGIDVSKYKDVTFEIRKGGDAVVRYCKKNKIFKTNYARLGSFLTSFCRLQLYETIQKLKLQDKVLLINTDGFVLQNATLPDDMFGDGLGKFKVAKNKDTNKPRLGTCVITNSNSYKFI